MSAQMPQLEALPPVVLTDGCASRSGDVDVWYWFYERDMDDAFGESYDELLTGAERTRHRAFLFEADRRMFLATRALVRTALSHYAPVAPRDWRFAQASHGKPYICGPSEVTNLHFNLTNAKGLVACAISGTQGEVGVDVESLGRVLNTATLADSVLSRSEWTEFRAVPKAQQRAQFLRHWTLKESYAKARGIGLTLPFNRVSFRLDPEIQLSLGLELEDEAERWRFAQVSTSSHVLAVCAEAKAGSRALSVHGINYTPLRGAVWQHCASQD
jgi:4'-phosphopantetheinyl transferase